MIKSSKPTLILLRGVSGSGKSSVSELFSDEFWCLEADSFFCDAYGSYNFDPTKLGEVHKQCQDECFEQLSNGNNVIVSNTSTRSQDVEVYRKIAKSSGANFISLIVENYHGNKDTHNVPEETLQRQEHQLRNSIKLR